MTAATTLPGSHRWVMTALAAGANTRRAIADFIMREGEKRKKVKCRLDLILKELADHDLANGAGGRWMLTQHGEALLEMDRAAYAASKLDPARVGG